MCCIMTGWRLMQWWLYRCVFEFRISFVVGGFVCILLSLLVYSFCRNTLSGSVGEEFLRLMQKEWL